MLQKDKIASAVIVLSIAVGIGHFVQNSPAEAAYIDPGKAEKAAFTPSLASGIPLPPMALSKSRAGELRNLTSPLIYASAVGPSSLLPPLEDVSHEGFDAACDASLTAATQSDAMVRLSFFAPCKPSSAVTVAHGPIRFSQKTDETGAFDILIPALSRSADFAVTLPGGAVTLTHADVFTADGFRRVALMWEGDETFDLHAFENGAQFGEVGHIWSQSPTPRRMIGLDGSSFMTALGEEPHRIQIYSHPVSLHAGSENSVEIMIEVVVSNDSCGREVSAQLAVSDGMTPAQISPFSVALPDCGTGGGFIQLKNVLEGLTLAQN